MLWFLLSFLSALMWATADALTKRFFSGLNPYEMGLIRLLYLLPFLIPLFFLVPIPSPPLLYPCLPHPHRLSLFGRTPQSLGCRGDHPRSSGGLHLCPEKGRHPAFGPFYITALAIFFR
ncbi:MAG: hypothetical protein JRI46_11280 [Deltaproteobacteria bacterium]|nr:hypothetical protein [Deltaproteobacteria bacterium]